MAEEVAQTEEELQAIRDEIAAEEFDVTPAKKPEEKAEPVVEEVAEPVVEPVIEDPWAGVSPALRKVFEEATAKASSVDAIALRLRQAEGRIGNLQTKLTAAEKAEEEKPPAPTKEEIEVAAKEKESWEALKEEFPEWAVAVDERFSKTNTEFEQRQKALEQSQVLSSQRFEKELTTLKTSLKEDLATDIQKTMLSFKHPNWETVIATPEYQVWLASQPDEIKKKTSSTFAKDASTVLDKFVEDKNKTKKTPAEIAEERKQRLEAAVSVKGTKGKPVKAEADMSEEELRKKYAEEVWAE